ncbi:ThuA domain-containing protein [Sediminibacterium ginsengisoli]|uniref:Trehalose utilisation n=1 Tax=Sediminibacterium ginsengisoli TaxID=413434 RepID=A0A1T4QDN7_9BACT|nr:ThuA domain-containing protein [Sediminibacterium ginsengisoli]SKA01358.1 Trehalose utilisation [Sediminibacterium ginsengisoli]
MKFFLPCILVVSILVSTATYAQQPFKVIAFYTAKQDPAHISFVHEANRWFPQMAAANGFVYDSTNNWNNLNDSFLTRYQVVLFLDTRPESDIQRSAFERYMRKGGGWIGFHFAAFALTPSSYPQNWDWYHNEFLGSGSYGSNTWRPTSAIVKTEARDHPFLKNIPSTFTTAPNEWYRWEKDLRKNADIEILLSIDPSSFPLGTGPKAHEIWHSGYYPVAWSNRKYNMLYLNMGHNDIDYEHKTNSELSFTFSNEVQNRFLLNALTRIGQRSMQKN